MKTKFEVLNMIIQFIKKESIYFWNQKSKNMICKTKIMQLKLMKIKTSVA